MPTVITENKNGEYIWMIYQTYTLLSCCVKTDQKLGLKKNIDAQDLSSQCFEAVQWNMKKISFDIYILYMSWEEVKIELKTKLNEQ